MTHLLLIEDDPLVRSMLSETLRDEGFELTVAHNGRQGLEAYAAHPADVVITDIFMPGQDGVESIVKLRKAHPDARIIAISGGSPNLSPGMLLSTAERVGATHSFTKPVDIPELLAAIRELTS